MMRAAHVLRGAGEQDRRSFAATACSLIDGRVLATVPIMDYVYGATIHGLAGWPSKPGGSRRTTVPWVNEPR